MLMNGTWSLTSSRLAEGGGDGQIICLYGGEQRPFLLSLGQRMRGKDPKEKKHIDGVDLQKEKVTY